MTCSGKYKQNCPTGGTKVTAEEGDGRARCIHAACEAPLQGSDSCTKGHSQCPGESAREMLAEVRAVFAQQARVTDPATLEAMLTRAHKLAERSHQYATGIEDAELAGQAAELLQAVQATLSLTPADSGQTWWQQAGLVDDGTGRFIRDWRQPRELTKVSPLEVDGAIRPRPRCPRCNRPLARDGTCPTCWASAVAPIATGPEDAPAIPLSAPPQVAASRPAQAPTTRERVRPEHDGTGRRLPPSMKVVEGTKVAPQEVDGAIRPRPRCPRCNRPLAGDGTCRKCGVDSPAPPPAQAGSAQPRERARPVDDGTGRRLPLSMRSQAVAGTKVAPLEVGPRPRCPHCGRVLAGDGTCRKCGVDTAAPVGDAGAEDAPAIPLSTPGPVVAQERVADTPPPSHRAPGVATDAPFVFYPSAASLAGNARARGLPVAREGWCVCGQPRRRPDEPCTNPRCAAGNMANPEAQGTTCVRCGNHFWPADDDSTRCPFCRTLYTKPAGDDDPRVPTSKAARRPR